jgi:hypothetical protein
LCFWKRVISWKMRIRMHKCDLCSWITILVERHSCIHVLHDRKLLNLPECTILYRLSWIALDRILIANYGFSAGVHVVYMRCEEITASQSVVALVTRILTTIECNHIWILCHVSVFGAT